MEKVAKMHKQPQACFSLLLICCEVMKVRPIARNHTNCCMRFAFHCIDQQSLSLCSHWSFWLQDNALTPKRRSYMEAVSNSQLNMNPMEVRAHPHRPWEYNHNANKNPKATHKSSNTHSRRRSPWVKWPPAVPIWLQWAIARSTFWRSVNSQVTISD